MNILVSVVCILLFLSKSGPYQPAIPCLWCLLLLVYRTHCPNNNLILCIKTEPLTARADATVYSMCTVQYTYFLLRNQTYRTVLSVLVCHCFCSNRDRLGYYADIQIIFGTVQSKVQLACGVCCWSIQYMVASAFCPQILGSKNTPVR